MPVCIAGMHRSGTSMVARLLNLCGMHIGSANDILPPAPDNPEGFWEHRHFVALNDALLNALGGAWDLPPQADYGWEQSDAVTQLQPQARRLLGHFGGQSKWGWKDPRNSLTMAFWKSLIPEMRVVICLRNPGEVARSLSKRGSSSLVFGFGLWYEYNRSVLSNTPTEHRLITPFENYFRSPREELVRVIRWLGWETPDHVIERAVASVSRKLRHNTAANPLLELKGAPQRVIELYREMCSESEDQIMSRSGSHISPAASSPESNNQGPVSGVPVEYAFSSIGRPLRASCSTQEAEGNHLEPDLKNGRAYLEATGRAPFSAAASPKPSGADVIGGQHVSRMGRDAEPAVLAPLINRLVSIVIPVTNGVAYTRRCLSALQRNTSCRDYEIIIVDNASTDETSSVLMNSSGPNLSVITNRENAGYTKAANQGARAASGKFVLFLNNDTEPQPGWLDALVGLMESDDRIGISGCKLVYPDGRLQEAGGIVFNEGSGWNYGRFDDPNDPKYSYVREVDYVSGAALLVRHDLLKRLNYFDEQYSPGYYEDTDLCFGARSLGYKVMYSPFSVVTHHEGASSRIDSGRGIKQYQVVNKQKFVQKWSPVLKQQYPPDRESLTAASSRDTIGDILIIDPCLPMFDRASGSLRLLSIISLLKQQGYHVTYIARDGRNQEQYRIVLEKMGVEVYATDPANLNEMGHHVDARPINLKQILTLRRYSVAYLSFYDIACQYLPAIRSVSPCTSIVIDTVGIHFLREQREADLSQDQAASERAECTKKAELAIYSQADALITVTEEDWRHVEAHLPWKLHFVVPNVHSAPERQWYPLSRSGLLFIGNFNHTPNTDAVLYFVSQVFPLIKEAIPDVILRVVGNNPPDAIRELNSRDIIVTGYVPSTEPYLQKARVSIAPLRYGAGMKGKIGEAMAHGLPVVTTSMGAEGMGLVHGQTALIADTPAEFAKCVKDLHSDESLWSAISENSQLLVKNNFSPQRINSSVHNMMKRLSEMYRTNMSQNVRQRAVPIRGPSLEVTCEDMSGRMKNDRDERAREDAAYCVHPAKRLQSEEELDAPGKGSVAELVEDDLEAITGGRNPKMLRVLEIGCGLGRMTKHMAGIFGEVHGIDVSREMISGTRERLRGIENVFLRETAGKNLSDFPAGFFDLVFSSILFQHVPDRDIVLNYIKEACRVLKPEGIFKFQVQGCTDPAWSALKKDTRHGETVTFEDISGISKELGFVIIKHHGQGTQYSWYTLRKGARPYEEPRGEKRISMATAPMRIVTIQPEGYLHSEALAEVVETMKEAFLALGTRAELSRNTFSPDCINLVLGWHLLQEAKEPSLPRGCILYNLEQMDDWNRHLVTRLVRLSKRCELWDYSRRNIDILHQSGIRTPIHHVPIGTMPELTRIRPAKNQDIDVLFYGSVNPRRKKILNALMAEGINLRAVFGAYGDERDSLIARAKVVLNLHYYEASIVEIVRLSYLWSNGKAVVAECNKATEIPDGLEGAARFVSYGKLVDACKELIADENARKALERRSFEIMSARRETEVLKRVLAGEAAVPAGLDMKCITGSSAFEPKVPERAGFCPRAL